MLVLSFKYWKSIFAILASVECVLRVARRLKLKLKLKMISTEVGRVRGLDSVNMTWEYFGASDHPFHKKENFNSMEHSSTKNISMRPSIPFISWILFAGSCVESIISLNLHFAEHYLLAGVQWYSGLSHPVWSADTPYSVMFGGTVVGVLAIEVIFYVKFI